MTADNDELPGPYKRLTSRGSEYVLFMIEEDPVYSDDEEMTDENGPSEVLYSGGEMATDEDPSREVPYSGEVMEVPETSITLGSYMDLETIKQSEWNPKMLRALMPIHGNGERLRLDSLTSDLQAAISKVYEEDPRSEHLWKLVDQKTFDGYMDDAWGKDTRLWFKTFNMKARAFDEFLADNENETIMSEIPNSVGDDDDGGRQEVTRNQLSEMDLGS